MQFICYDRPAARHQLSYEVQAPLGSASQLHSICSVMICQLGSILLAESVSSAATRQLSCDVSAQLSSAQLLSKGSVASRQPSCQVSCNLLAEL